MLFKAPLYDTDVAQRSLYDINKKYCHTNACVTYNICIIPRYLAGR